MCIIVSKEKGKQLPTKATLKECFERNSDGAGIMYVEKGSVVIEKGLMTFEDFYRKLKDLKKHFGTDLTEKALVMHFRIGTSGKNDKATTHPFPITSDKNQLRATKTRTNVGMVHNGIISDYVKLNELSDTQNYIVDFVSVLKELDKEFYKNKRVLQMLKDTCKSKLCFLDNKENIYYVGDFIKDNGIMYSNSSYKPYQYRKYHSLWDYPYQHGGYYWGL